MSEDSDDHPRMNNNLLRRQEIFGYPRRNPNDYQRMHLDYFPILNDDIYIRRQEINDNKRRNFNDYWIRDIDDYPRRNLNRYRAE
jgi:hypothetical protein